MTPRRGGGLRGWENVYLGWDDMAPHSGEDVPQVGCLCAGLCWVGVWCPRWGFAVPTGVVVLGGEGATADALDAAELPMGSCSAWTPDTLASSTGTDTELTNHSRGGKSKR